jgi:mannitol-1-phosphate 5-dehydrogenase
VFEEKPDLLPFEEAKLYGHNATHALLGYLAGRLSLETMSEIDPRGDLYALGRKAFLEESGRALVSRHTGVDDLFTEAGYRAYADDLLERMINPHLGDRIERVTRDPRRKLSWNDRLVGTMRVVLDEGFVPEEYARGAAAALEQLARLEGVEPSRLLDELWPEPDDPPGRKAVLSELIRKADLATVSSQ